MAAGAESGFGKAELQAAETHEKLVSSSLPERLLLDMMIVRILREPGFKPDKDYVLESLLVTAENAAQMYERFTVPGMN